jgi:hypothetical protein
MMRAGLALLDVLAGGGNYQTQINAALRSFVQERNKPLEAVLRHVVREELRRYGKR